MADTTGSTVDAARISAMDARAAARLLKGVRAAALAGDRPPAAPRPEIAESWRRMLAGGVHPDRDARSRMLSAAETEERRHVSPLREILPVLREGLLPALDEALHIMVVADADGRLLWREGHSSILRKADRLGFAVGADWDEAVVGTNGVGTALVARRPVQVFSAEHFVSSHHDWTCAGAPVRDPRDGRLLGVVDVSGPLATMHPATLAWVSSVARLAERELRVRHLESLERLRTVAAPLLARLPGRALAVDPNGWTAAVTGLVPAERIPLPKSFGPGRVWVPQLGECVVEPLPGRLAAAGRAGPYEYGGVADRAGPQPGALLVGDGVRALGELVAGAESAPRGAAVPAGGEPARALGGGAGRGGVRGPDADGDGPRGAVPRTPPPRGGPRAPAVPLRGGRGGGADPPPGPGRAAPALDGSGGDPGPPGPHGARHGSLSCMSTITLTTWSLEMTSPADLVAAAPAGPEISIVRAEVPSPEFSRFLYASVGGDIHWTDRLSLTRAQWVEQLDRPGVETWVAYDRGTPAGYVELDPQEDGVVGSCISVSCRTSGAAASGGICCRWASPARGPSRSAGRSGSGPGGCGCTRAARTVRRR
ncbi:hypothetical protein SAVIM40S_07466 [Streptomyces avidinii]